MNLGIPETIVLVIVGLLIFGPKRLPELARSAGRAIREFKSALVSVTELPPEQPANAPPSQEGEEKPNADVAP
jgi:sec-independent protein translocase protein TatA